MRDHILRATALDRMPGRVLEVGCGTGAILQSLAKTSTASTHGLDHNFTYLKQAQKNTAGTMLTCGDAYHLPFAANSLEGVLCHFLLLWLSNPDNALLEMRRVVKSGGWIIAFAEPDYTGRIDHPGEFQQLAAYQTTALRQQGANVAIGRSLRGLFHQTGLQNIQAGIISGHWQTEFDAADWQQEWKVLQTDLQDEVTDQELHKLQENDRKAWEKGQRILFIPTFYAWGQVP